MLQPPNHIIDIYFHLLRSSPLLGITHLSNFCHSNTYQIVFYCVLIWIFPIPREFGYLFVCLLTLKVSHSVISLFFGVFPFLVNSESLEFASGIPHKAKILNFIMVWSTISFSRELVTVWAFRVLRNLFFMPRSQRYFPYIFFDLVDPLTFPT